MAKRSKGKAKDAQSIESNAGALSHNPLAGLAALRGIVSETAATPAAAPTPAKAPPKPVKRSAPPAKSETPPASPSAEIRKTPTVASRASTSPLRFTGKIVVRRENKGRAGKTVTRISGLPRAELDALAKEMKKALGCGATVEGEDLLLLGSLVDRAAAWFEKAGVARLVKGN